MSKQQENPVHVKNPFHPRIWDALTQLMNPPGVVQALQATIIFKHNAFILMKQYNKWL